MHWKQERKKIFVPTFDRKRNDELLLNDPRTILNCSHYCSNTFSISFYMKDCFLIKLKVRYFFLKNKFIRYLFHIYIKEYRLRYHGQLLPVTNANKKVLQIQLICERYPQFYGQISTFFVGIFRKALKAISLSRNL